MHPTLYPDVNDLLDTLLGGVRRTFGEKLGAVYLYGSLTSGDFDPEASDIDVLVVLASPVSDSEFAVLQSVHRQLAGENPGWEGRIEAVYMPSEGLRTFRSQRTPIAWIAPASPSTCGTRARNG